MDVSIVSQDSGIYMITCKANGKIYIGSSINLRQRFFTHSSKLKNGNHENPYLQNSWDKYGERLFEFNVIELVNPSLLLDREQYWLNKTQCYKRSIGFNLAKLVGKPPSPKGKKLSTETKEKIKTAAIGRTHSLETRKKLSLLKRGVKVSNKSVATRKRTSEIFSKKYTVINPKGEIFHVIGITQFCKSNELDASTMCKVAKGKQLNHKGWKCYYTEG